MKANQQLEQLLKESEADRAARLEVIHKLENQLKELEPLKKVLGQIKRNLEVLKSSKLVRLLLTLGLVSDPEKSSQPEEDTE